jgi:ABC-type transporter Mla maintaining outer membrane lipid asymmetry ATPase subunit MlaF
MIPALEISGVSRKYGGLRPLRIAALSLAPAERVAIVGIDAAGAEVLVNLITGAAVPDEGLVRVFGRATSDIASGDEWLGTLDRFGIVSPRAVILEGATVQQNLAMPFTLEIDPVPTEVCVRVDALAGETGIAPESLELKAGEAPADVRARVHLARAIALDPSLLLLEHPTVGLDPRGAAAFAADLIRAADARALAALAITQDETFAGRVAHRALKLQPASGELKPLRKGWFR